MSADNKIVQSLWIGNHLSVMELLCINSYIKNGHEFHLYVYDRQISIPQYAVLYDANEIIPEENIFLDSRGSVASFADWFRYKLLYEKGGWWVDMDTVCLKPFAFEKAYCFAQEEVGSLSIINIGYIKSPMRADYLEDCLNSINEYPSKAGIAWGTFGLSLIREVLSLYDFEPYLQKPAVFCPIPYYQLDKLINDISPIISEEAYAVHLWNEMWRLNDLNKDGVYSRHSLYEWLKDLYLH
ncbi:glycosyltransferase [Parabacteroides sp. Marseille-P3160]|uniref:glycosyltransferase n=1 Tax=Parabacteroides sp. Marseille-P3160 TaxID=1917887 RepID=UPI0009BC27BA|nr:glycosyltransferase [Parabacteroides sp. Marseille-P3160]